MTTSRVRLEIFLKWRNILYFYRSVSKSETSLERKLNYIESKAKKCENILCFVWPRSLHERSSIFSTTRQLLYFAHCVIEFTFWDTQQETVKRGQFHQCVYVQLLHAQILKAQKSTNDLTVILAIFRSESVKAACRWNCLSAFGLVYLCWYFWCRA